nr:putative reverse transcriptase domain-containing protein [Tanacetum cinerariifolium]
IWRRMIDKEGNVSRFQEYHTSDDKEEELSEHPPYNKYGFVDHPQLQMEDQRNEFAPYPLPPLEGNMNAWLTDDANDSDLESTAMALTRWIKKKESVIDNIRCLANQRVKYAASSFIGKALTWWNTQVQARGRDAANAMECADHVGYTDRFHKLAKLVPHLVTPEAKRVTRILTDEAVCSGTLAKAGEKKKERDEARRNQSENQLALEGNRNTQGNENRARGRAFNVNAVNALQDPNVVTGTYSLNNLYATVLLDSSASFSFISTKFAPLLNKKSSIANPGYVIEVASVEMDWLSNQKAMIVCHEKTVRIPIEGGNVLCVQGERNVGKTKTLMSTKTKEDHENHLRLMLDLLRKEKLYAKFFQVRVLIAKCTFSWTRVRSFLGLAGYYRRFIKNFSKIAKPLTSSTQKNQKYKLGEKQEEAFQTLKNNLCNALILSLPDGVEDFAVYCDASNQELGCVLMQRDKRRLELFSDYECEIKYHLGKAFKDENVIAKGLNGTDQQMEKGRGWKPILYG